jgi:hypothetical protein
MIYDKFNQYIEEKIFLLEKKGEIILYAIDESIIELFIENENITKSDFCKNIAIELKSDWDKQCKQNNFFGICAIQVYIASLMHNDNNFTSEAYNPRFENFLGIDLNKRQKLFSKYQIKLWESLKSWGVENDFYINIPKKENLQWNRLYVSYPLSQALLNKEDLKMSAILFEKVRINKTEYYSFPDFSIIIKNADNSNCMSSHYYKVKERILSDFGNSEQINWQIYIYFNNEWDGTYPQRDEKRISINRSYRNLQNAHLYLSKTLDRIIVLDDEYNDLDKIFFSNKDLFSQIEKYQKIYSNEFLIFKIEDIFKEAEYVRNFELGESYVIICKQYSKASKFIYSLCKTEKIQNSIYDIFRTQVLKKKVKHPFWEKYFSLQSRNYKIEGGIKLAYKSWMLGCGPKIIFNEISVVWINGKKIEESEIDCTNFPIGIYKIVKDSSIEKFEIKAPSYTKNVICRGWSIEKHAKRWNPVDDNFQISGLINNFPDEIKRETVNNWAKLLTINDNYTKYSSTVLKAIKRAHYGI